MHFPTSIPRPTRSPAAGMNPADKPPLDITIHQEPYDGPMPVLPKIPRRPMNSPQYRRHISPSEPPMAQATPIYSYIPPQVKKAPSIPATTTSYASGTGLRPPAPTSAGGSFTSPNASSANNVSVPNIDGAGKLLKKVVPAKGKAIFQGKAGKLFGKKNKPEDEEDSPTEASEFYELKRKKSQKSDTKSTDPGIKSSNSSRARLAARLLRPRGKPGGDIETNLDLDDADHHPFEAARKRFRDQRERKMRRGSPPDKTVQNPSPPEEKPPKEKRHHHQRIADHVRKGVRFASSKDLLSGYHASKEEDRAEQDVGIQEGSRMGNAVRRMSDHLMPNQEEREAEGRRASWTSQEHSGPSRRGSHQRNQMNYESTSSSGSPEELHIPRAADVPDFPPPPNGLMQISPQSPLSPLDNPAYQAYQAYETYEGQAPAPLFPPRPPAPFYRPTLSPVSSRSPVPTSVGNAAPESPLRQSVSQSWDGRQKSRPVSSSPLRSVSSDPSASSIHLPLFDTNTVEVIPPSPSLTPQRPPPQLTIRNGPPTASSLGTEEPRESVGLSPIMEQPTPEPSRRSSQKSSKPSSIQPPSIPNDSSISDLNINPDNSGSASTISIPSHKLRTRSHSHQNLSGPASISTPKSTPLPEPIRPREPPPHPTPSPYKIPAKTPTQSAVDFWHEADSSLAPSESASAQPPNYYSQPPPSFWKVADQTLAAQESTGPTMEEWIASLPSLGLGLGTWGNHDGALDWKYFQSLQAKNKLKKSRSGSSVKSKASSNTGTAKSVKDMIEENIKNLEKVIEEIEEAGSVREEGLTPEEVEDLDEFISDSESPVDNLPPPITNPNLLHPEYLGPGTPGAPKSPGPILSSQRPKSRLGRETAIRLDNMEKYWAEQSLAMGTVLKKMLVIVDTLIVKEREQTQRDRRRVEMGWESESDE
jgi:hypothetical protein